MNELEGLGYDELIDNLDEFIDEWFEVHEATKDYYMPLNITELDRYKGCLLGLAVGDAVGTTVEFKKRGTFEPVTDMVGGGIFKLEAGKWTDDTSMALCLAESLISNGFDPIDQMKRYVKWYKKGYLSSTGKCFDIGSMTRKSLDRFIKDSKNPWQGSTDSEDSGNGALMRLAPVVMYNLSLDYPSNHDYITRCTITTHGSSECTQTSRILSHFLTKCLVHYNKFDIFEIDEMESLTYTANISSDNIKSICNGEFITKGIDEIKGSGYCVESLEAALYCFYNTDNFADAILMATNLGDDADTTAAITGQLAGAYYGIRGIPKEWLERLYMRDYIEALAVGLYEIGS